MKQQIPASDSDNDNKISDINQGGFDNNNELSEEYKRDILKRLFDSIDLHGDGYITKFIFVETLKDRGIDSHDIRLINVMKELSNYGRNEKIDFDSFCNVIGHNITIIEKIITKNLVIPEFAEFRKDIENIYLETKKIDSGALADYIPQLARVNPDQYAVSICTIDGQFLEYGNIENYFCIQSICKPINYCIALELNGEEYVHSHVGREPSGRSFNEIALNRHNLPHNPMINAGAIMCSSLIHPEQDLADRFNYVSTIWQKLSGNARIGFNNSVYHSELSTADRNFALAHYMKEVGAFPAKTLIKDTVDFYFQNCAIELNSSNLAMVAATFANAGFNPITGEKIFSLPTVQNCLSLMYSCGMYDFSGEFAFTVGLPAKSGVSGGLMLVIPNVMGIALWSPKLDIMGNTVRGVEFSKQLVKQFNFHNYDSLVGQSKKVDPRKDSFTANIEPVFQLIWAASQGDLNEIQQLFAKGIDLDSADYDGRTALHLAAAENQIDVVKFLISKNINLEPVDRWGKTPLADAKTHENNDIVKLLTK
ncbi:MAG: glutaminase A [Pseudomonadota bacterium]